MRTSVSLTGRFYEGLGFERRRKDDLREIDVRGAELELWSAMPGPRSISPEIVEKMSAAAIGVLKDADVCGRLLTAGWQPSPSNGAGLRSRMVSDTRVFGGIIMLRDIRVDA